MFRDWVTFGKQKWVNSREPRGPPRSGNDHFANFIQCVRSRNATDLHAPIEEGHRSCALVLLANTSYRLGRSLKFDTESERVVNDEEANRLLYGEDGGYREPFVIPTSV